MQTFLHACIHVGSESGNNGVVVKEFNRSPQHLMTNDPDKLWPGGILPYHIDVTVGNGLTMYKLLKCTL